jgi:putative ABC transport system permease protein
VRNFVEKTIQERHQGEKDVTVVTQDAVLSTFDDILGALTLAVGGIAAISLAVAGILIMNVMLVAVEAELGELLAAAEKVTERGLSEAPTLTVIRHKKEVSENCRKQKRVSEFKLC